MARQHLTDIAVRQLLHPDSGDVKYWDTVVPGFGVRVSARSKSWFIVQGKSRQLSTLGKYPQISLQDARKEAKRLLATPAPEKCSVRLIDTITAYLEDCSTRLRPRTVAEYARPLALAPDIPLSDLAKSHLTSADPHAITAWKVFGNWCVRNELIDRNPFMYIPVSYGERERVLLPDEIKQLWAYEYPPFSDYLKVLLLTGQRRSQLTDFEVRGDTLFFPARIMKGKRDHIIPLTPLAQHHLERLRPFNSWSKAKARLDTHVPIPPFVLHDCRRTFSTIMAALKQPIHVTEKILDHRTGTVSGVSAIYNRHSYLEEARTSLLTYEAHIATLVSV